MTIYAILWEDEHGWNRLMNIEASSPGAAIGKYVADIGKGGTYVAIPARSWKPITVEVETVTRAKVVKK